MKLSNQDRDDILTGACEEAGGWLAVDHAEKIQALAFEIIERTEARIAELSTPRDPVTAWPEGARLTFTDEERYAVQAEIEAGYIQNWTSEDIVNHVAGRLRLAVNSRLNPPAPGSEGGGR